MSVKRLTDRVPSASVRTVATLRKHDLRFHKVGKDGSGKCDIHATDNPAHFVIGVVYDIFESEKPNLDRIEGLGNGYEQKEVALILPSGDIIRAVTYYATHIEPSLKPFHWYKHHVLTGAIENELPAYYAEKISLIESVVDLKETRHTFEMSIYDNSSLTKELNLRGGW